MPPKKKHVLRHPIHRPELEFILKAAEELASMDKARLQSEINLQLNNTRALCIILYSCGLRLNEGLSLTRQQLQQLVSGKAVQVFLSKNEKFREIQFSPAAQELWSEVMPPDFFEKLPIPPPPCDPKAQKDGLTNSQGTAVLNVRTANRWLEPLMRKLAESKFENLQKKVNGCLYDSHSFRIGWVTRTVKQIGLDGAREAVGHSDILTTKRYFRMEGQSAANRSNSWSQTLTTDMLLAESTAKTAVFPALAQFSHGAEQAEA